MNHKTLRRRIGTQTSRVRRTIDHSPPFVGPQTKTTDCRPSRSMPAGGYMSGWGYCSAFCAFFIAFDLDFAALIYILTDPPRLSSPHGGAVPFPYRTQPHKERYGCRSWV